MADPIYALPGKNDPVGMLKKQISDLQQQLYNGVEGPDADAIRKEIKDLSSKLAFIKAQGKL